jgi:hypothetical protein
MGSGCASPVQLLHDVEIDKIPPPKKELLEAARPTPKEMAQLQIAQLRTAIAFNFTLSASARFCP